MRRLQHSGAVLVLVGLLFTGAAPCSAAGRIKSPFPVRHEGAVCAVALAPDGRTLASGGVDQLVLLSDLESGKELHRLRGHQGRVSALAFSPDGKVLASGSRDNTVCLWDTATGKILHRCRGHERTVLALAFAPDGRHLVSASYDGTLRLWKTATGKSVCQTDAHADAVSSVCFSPDGKSLASGGYDKVVRYWAVEAGCRSLKLRHTLRPGGPEVTGVAFCLGGRYVAAGSPNGYVRLWDTVKGDISGVNHADIGSVLAVTASADGKTLVVAGLSGLVELFEASTGQVIGHLSPFTGEFSLDSISPLTGYPGKVRAVALSPVGLTVAAGTGDGRLHVWSVAAQLAAREPVGKLSAKELDRLWDGLRASDARAGYRAAAILASRPEVALPLLRARLRPVPRPDRAKILRLIAQLDGNRFAMRERAAAELEKVVEGAEALLRQALANKPSLELRRRIERLLLPLEERSLPPERLRANRALLAVELMGTPEAKAYLKELAGGTAGAWLTCEARRALARLALVKSR